MHFMQNLCAIKLICKPYTKARITANRVPINKMSIYSIYTKTEEEEKRGRETENLINGIRCSVNINKLKKKLVAIYFESLAQFSREHKTKSNVNKFLIELVHMVHKICSFTAHSCRPFLPIFKPIYAVLGYAAIHLLKFSPKCTGSSPNRFREIKCAM